MPGLSLTTDAFVLLKRPPTEAFQPFTIFSPAHGLLTVHQRLPGKTSRAPLLDLCDEAALILESSNQGRTWFVRESRLLRRPAGIGRSYESLQAAATLATLVARNPVSPDSRPAVTALLRETFAALAEAPRPDAACFKAIYRFARDEGHPVKQQWLPSLPPADRRLAIAALNLPLAEQTVPPADLARLQDRLLAYLRDQADWNTD